MRPLVRRFTDVLGHRKFPWIAGALSALLLFPALWGGFQLDDHFQRTRLLGLGEDPLQLFVFYDGDPANARAQMDQGVMPWWANPAVRHANLRYLSVLSMQLDYALWPHHPAWMHLHSLLWLAATVAAAGLLYRDLFRSHGSGAERSVVLAASGLATLLYAVDDAHALPTAYLANRNALLCAFFGLVSVWTHHRARALAVPADHPGDLGRGPGLTACRITSPLALALALLSGELAVSTVAFLGAHALLLDRDTVVARARSLAPHLAIAAAWLVVHRLGGFGSEGSGVYVDPLREPLAFARVFLDRAAILWIGQWTPFPSDWGSVLELGSAEARPIRVAGLVLLALLGTLFWRLLRASALARFFALGAAVSLVPISAVTPQNRLLFFVGFGCAGLLAQLAFSPGRSRIVVAVLLGVHLLLAPASAYVFLDLQTSAARRMERAEASLPNLDDWEQRDLILLNPPDSVYATISVPMMRTTDGRPRPRRLRALAHGGAEVRLTPLDAYEVRLDLDPGLFPDPFSRYFRASNLPFEQGDVVQVDGMTVTIEDPGDAFGPTQLHVRFDRPLRSAELVWRHWDGSVWQPLELPPVAVTKRFLPQGGFFDL